MSDQVFDDVALRVVRSEDQGAYLIQIGVEGAYRTFASMKLGKLDFLREQARADQNAEQQRQRDAEAQRQADEEAQRQRDAEARQSAVPPPPPQ